MIGKKEFGLYIHIPFCSSKCGYCHFYSTTADGVSKDRYVAALLSEWKRMQSLLSGCRIVSLYLGGGTPTTLGPGRIATIVDSIVGSQLPFSDELEISMETNPDICSQDDIQLYRSMGINRLSIGLQSFSPLLLKQLRRRYTPNVATQSVYDAVSAGFDDISVDVLYDIPTQTIPLWRDTLSRVVELPITHLSLYNLIVEEDSLWYRKKDVIERMMPDDESSARMLAEGVDFLEQHGFARYEISAFCRGGKRSRHNCGYWSGREYIGLGPSAHSYWEGSRYKNISDLEQYCHGCETNTSIVDFEETLMPDAHRKEMLAIGLRLVEGIEIERFQKRYGAFEQDTLVAMQTGIDEGLLTRYDGRLFLTNSGRTFYDTVAVSLL